MEIRYVELHLNLTQVLHRIKNHIRSANMPKVQALTACDCEQQQKHE